MSRSYNKVAGFKDCDRFMKKYANRRLRRIPIDIEDEFEPVGDYNSYRKYTNPWNLCDWTYLYFTDSQIRAEDPRDYSVFWFKLRYGEKPFDMKKYLKLMKTK